MENKKRLTDVNHIIRNLTAMKSMYDAIALDGMIKALEEAPAVDATDVMRGMWISVKDRLPDSNGLYIVTACDEGCSAGEGIWYDTVVVTAEYYDGIWTWFEGGSEYDLSGIVTHWMPLPEPPEEDKT